MFNKYLKKKNFLFFRLTLLTLSISIFLKIFNFDSYFLEISKPLKKKKLIELLKKIHIFWICNDHIDINSFRKIQRIKSYLTNKISGNFSNLIWNDNLKKEFHSVLNFELFVIDKLHKDVEKLVTLLVGKKKLSSTNKSDYLLSLNIFNYLMKPIYKDITFINFFSFLSFFLLVLKKFFYLVFKRLLNFLNIFHSGQKKTFMKKKLFQQQVIYFPHKGLLHGKGLKKLFFHSNSINEFKKENIIHIELHGSNYNDTYEELGIEPIQWNQISFKFNLKQLKSAINIIKTNNTSYFHKIILTMIYLHFIIIKSKLSKFKNIKLAAFGYDFLASPSIIAVCNFLKIKTISYQTRSTTAFFYKKNLFFDYYFCFGDKMKKIYKKHHSIKKIYSIGNYFSNQTPNLNFIEKNIRKKKQNYKQVCLVFDHHTKEDYFIDKQDPIVNFENNLVFYNDLFEIASKFKNVLFILKSKNLSWKNQSGFNSIVKKFYSIDNLEISRNTSLPDLYRFSDFAYGVITSGLDDMLALNKPVIIKDISGHPSKTSDYGILLAKSKKELINKIELIINKNEEFHKQILDLKREIFVNYENDFKEKIFKEILLENKK